MVKQTTMRLNTMHLNTIPLKKNLWLIIFFAFFLVQSTSLFAEVTATTGRTVLSIDETIELTIKSDSSSDDPDLSSIENNFQILGRSQSQNYSYINGNASRTHTWNITLLPKRTGEITIPALKVGNESTRPIHLVIQKQSTSPGIDGKDVYLKITMSDTPDSDTLKESYYVQQQIIITVQLFHRIRFSNATLSDLEIENTVVEKLGNDANYSKHIANNRYNIIERRYAIYPQQSGPLTIPALTFSGNAEISQSFSLFSRPGRQIISRTKPVTLDILAIPDDYTGKIWLPAESLDIEAEILEDTDSIVAGEAITRNIIVRAKGLLGSQLPAITVPSSKTLKTYPDKEKLSNQLVNGKVMGIRHDTVAIIPLKPGSFTLPEIKIDWWNTKTDQQETSRLAARSLLAKTNSEDSVQTPEVKPVKQAKNGITDEASDKGNNKIIEKIIFQEPPITKNLWFWISLILAILWLITLALLIAAPAKKKQPQKHTSAADKSSQNELKTEQYLQNIYNACQNNEAHKTGKALINWAKYYYNQPMLCSLSGVSELLDNDPLNHSLKEAINHLESCQYSQNKQQWLGNDLSSALKAHLHQDIAAKKVQKNKVPKAFSSLNP